jgi:hypothetical protein
MHVLETGIIFVFTAEDSNYLKEINKQRNLNRGRKFYNASDLNFVLFGTGIFHFKATLGEFGSFDEVSGYILVSIIRIIVGLTPQGF